MRLPAFDRALLGSSLVAIGVLAATFPHVGLTVVGGPLAQLAGVVALLAAVTWFYVRRGATRLADLVRVLLWTLVLNVLCSLLFYLPVRLGAPLADATLTRVDTALGYSSANLVAWTRAHPALDDALGRVYASLEVFGIASVATPPFLGRVDRAQTMLLAIVASVVVTLVLATMLPGVGPWEPQGFAPTPAQAACGIVVHRLASGAPYAIDLHYRDPILVLPSWHTIFAVLGALAWRPFRFAWPVAVAWSALIVLSTLTTGWHYEVDVIAGIAVALAAHAVAVRALARLAPNPPPPSSRSAGAGGP